MRTESQLRRQLRKGHRATDCRQPAEAVAAFEKAIAAAPDDARGFIQLAVAQSRRGDCEAAKTAAHAMLERFADNAAARFFAARCLLECDAPASAKPLLQEIAAAQPENMLAHAYLALCELSSGAVEAAAAHLERAGSLGNSDFLALFSYEVERRLAPTPPVTDGEAPPPSEPFVAKMTRLQERASRHSGRTLRGQIVRRRIIRKLFRLGERAFEREHFADALAAFGAARCVGGGGGRELLGEGLSAMPLGQPKHAAQVLATAHSIDPADGIVASSYATALYRCCLFHEALAVFQAVEPAGPDDFHANYGRGACLAALAQKWEALEHFRCAFDQFYLDTIEDCLMPSWRELLKRDSAKGGEPAHEAASAAEGAAGTQR